MIAEKSRYAPKGAWKMLGDGFIKVSRNRFMTYPRRYYLIGWSYIDLRDVLEILTQFRNGTGYEYTHVSFAIKGRNNLLETNMRKSELNSLVKAWTAHHRS
jgi:hypothetical protein